MSFILCILQYFLSSGLYVRVIPEDLKSLITLVKDITKLPDFIQNKIGEFLTSHIDFNLLAVFAEQKMMRMCLRTSDFLPISAVCQTETCCSLVSTRSIFWLCKSCLSKQLIQSWERCLMIEPYTLKLRLFAVRVRTIFLTSSHLIQEVTSTTPQSIEENEDQLEMLYGKYFPFVLNRMHDYPHATFSLDDLLQEAHKGFLRFDTNNKNQVLMMNPLTKKWLMVPS